MAVALLCPSAAAQTQYAADPGAYVVVEDLDPVPFGDDRVGLGGGVGWRFASGWDAGLEFGVGLTDFGRRFETNAFGGERRVRVGVAVGRTVSFGDRAGLRVEGGARLGRVDVDRQPADVTVGGRAVSESSRSYAANEGRVRGSVGVYGRVGVGRAVLQPTALAEGAWHPSTVTAPGGRFTLRDDAGGGPPPVVRVGVALPVTAPLFGRLVTIEPRFTVDPTRGYPDTSFRLRFN